MGYGWDASCQLKRPRPLGKSRKDQRQSETKATSKPATPKPVKKKVPVSRKMLALDLSALPVENVAQLEKWICLACVLDVLRAIWDSPQDRGSLRSNAYAPSVQELYTPAITRPYFEARSVKDDVHTVGRLKVACQAVGSPHREHEVDRCIEAPNLKSLPDKQFLVLEEQTTRQHAFYDGWTHQRRSRSGRSRMGSLKFRDTI